jgi:hypothetical protein
MGAGDKQDVSLQMFYDGVWNEIADETFVEETITTLWGQGSEGAAPRPAKINFTLNNETDKFRISNPESPLYGKAGRNTPVRLAVDTDTIMTAEATSMAPDRTIDFMASMLGDSRGRATVDVEAAGLLRRIGQWTTKIKSAHTTYDLTLPGLVGYWGIEDAVESAYPTPALPAGLRIAARDVGFSGAAGPDGSDKVARLNRNSLLGSYFADGLTASTSWAYFFSVKLSRSPATGDDGTLLSFLGSNNWIGSVRIVDTDMRLNVSGDSGTLINTSTSVLSTSWTSWNHFVVQASISGGTVTITVKWYNEASETTATLSGTFADTSVGVPVNWATFGSDSLEGAAWGHVGATIGIPAALTSTDRYEAIKGFPGETVGDRFARILAQENVVGTFLGDEAASMPMGPQRSGKLIDLLREMVDTEDGLLYDDRDDIGLVMRSRINRYTALDDVNLVLSYPTDISPPFREIVDDLDTHNVVTISDVREFEYTESLDSGPMSTQAPPDGVGEYKQEISVNLDDPEGMAPILAGWWLNRGTLQRSRYETVVIDLVENPQLKPYINALSIGEVIGIDGYEPDPFYLMVIGVARRIGSHSHIVTLTTVPAELFTTGIYDLTRYDSASTVLAEALDLTETGIDIKTTNQGDTWDVGGGYSWVINGERMSVTSVTAPVLSGGFYTQTGTVTRSANGISRTHSTGDEVHVANPGRYAL